MLFDNQIQTTSTSPCRTQVQPAASFLVCSLIFIEYKNQEAILNRMAFSSHYQEWLFCHKKCFDSQWNQSILKSSPYIIAEAAVPLYLDSSLLIKRAKLSNSGAGCLGFRSNSRLTRPERRTASNCSFVEGSFLAVSRRAATKSSLKSCRA